MCRRYNDYDLVEREAQKESELHQFSYSHQRTKSPAQMYQIRDDIASRMKRDGGAVIMRMVLKSIVKCEN